MSQRGIAGSGGGGGGSDLHVARFIVSAGGTAQGANYTTIASAYAAAVLAGGVQTVFIQPGTYTENLTLSPNVNLCAFTGDSLTPTVSITGTITSAYTGTCSITGIRLNATAGTALIVSGSNATVLNVKNCYLNFTAFTGIQYSTSNTASQLVIDSCTGDLGTTGIGYYTMTSTGVLTFKYSILNNSGVSVTASSNSAGTVNFMYSTIHAPCNTSSAGILMSNNAQFLSANNNTAITMAGTNTGSHEFTTFNGGTSSAISVGSGCTLNLASCEVFSSNTNAITGAGTLNYQNLSFTSSSALINVTTQNGGVAKGGLFQAPSAGFIGQQIRSYQSTPQAISPNTWTDITSISVTAGVWNISSICNLAGALTGNGFSFGISATSASNPGSFADNVASTPTMPTGDSNITLVVPAYRVTLTATTTYYMTINVNYTGGSALAYGRISATRVG